MQETTITKTTLLVTDSLYFISVDILLSFLLHHLMAANDSRCYDVIFFLPLLCYCVERRCFDLSDGRGLCILPRPWWSRTSTHVPAPVPACKTPSWCTLSRRDVTEGIVHPHPRKQAGGPAQHQLLARKCGKHTGGCLTGCVLDLYMAFMGYFVMRGCTAGVLGGK